MTLSPVVAALLATTVLAAGPLSGQQPRPLVEMSQVGPSEHRVAGFVLSRPQFLLVEATGAAPRSRSDDYWWGESGEGEQSWPAAAWIIDARTRAVVWDLRVVKTNRVAHVRRFQGPIRLPAGLYEAHFASYLSGSDLEREGAFHDFQFRISGAGRPARPRELREPLDQFRESAFAILAPDSGGITRVGFELSRPLKIEVVSLGELRPRRSFDYGWIQNADTRRIIWRMDYGNTRPAGGSDKNRMADDTLELAAGRYVATFASSPEHNPRQWNAVPAFDPAFWGLTLRVSDAAAKRTIRKFQWEPVPAGQTIAALLKIRDNELRSQSFALRRSVEARIYALGECTDVDQVEMADGAWLMDLTHQRRVWEMRCNQSAPAGGAVKNRLVDTLLRLDPGNYTLFYKSDGSHSTQQWNAAPPAEPRYWGVSLFPASERLAPDLVGPPARDTTGIIAELVRVRDGRKSRRFFSLESPTQIRIHALGEASGGELVDYGWIENGKTGDKVWTMDYGLSHNAGGAEKNRQVDSTLTLPAGRYVLYYQTDDSHAFGDWNADPPDEPESWGITLRKAQ